MNKTILYEYHASPYGGKFIGDKTAHKILQSGFYWPTILKDCFEWVKLCDQCQRMGSISRRHEIPLQGILVVQIFYVSGNRFHGTFSIFIWEFVHTPSCGLCIQMGGNNSLSQNDANTVVGFLQRNILSRFRAPRTIISDGGSHFATRCLRNS